MRVGLSKEPGGRDEATRGGQTAHAAGGSWRSAAGEGATGLRAGACCCSPSSWRRASPLGSRQRPPTAAALPDNRAYEMVTPPNKDNGGPYIRAGVFGGYQLSADGNAVSYPVAGDVPWITELRGLLPGDAHQQRLDRCQRDPAADRTPSRASCAPSNRAWSATRRTCRRGFWRTALNSAERLPGGSTLQLVPGEPQGCSEHLRGRSD